MTGRLLRRPVRRRGVPRGDAAGQHLEGNDKLLGAVTAPSRDDATVLSGVELTTA